MCHHQSRVRVLARYACCSESDCLWSMVSLSCWVGLLRDDPTLPRSRWLASNRSDGDSATGTSKPDSSKLVAECPSVFVGSGVSSSRIDRLYRRVSLLSSLPGSNIVAIGACSNGVGLSISSCFVPNTSTGNECRGLFVGLFFGWYCFPSSASLRVRSSTSALLGRPRFFVMVSGPDSVNIWRVNVGDPPFVAGGFGDSVLRSGGRGYRALVLSWDGLCSETDLFVPPTGWGAILTYEVVVIGRIVPDCELICRFISSNTIWHEWSDLPAYVSRGKNDVGCSDLWVVPCPAILEGQVDPSESSLRDMLVDQVLGSAVHWLKVRPVNGQQVAVIVRSFLPFLRTWIAHL